MANKISIDQVKHIAELVKLDIAGAKEFFSQILSETLNYISKLNELDTTNIEPTYQVGGLKNVYQSDGKDITLSVEDAISNAPEKSGDLFTTKAVFDR